MKAILEFTYPDDTIKLQQSLLAGEAFNALYDIRREIRNFEKYDPANAEQLVSTIKSIVNEVLIKIED